MSNRIPAAPVLAAVTRAHIATGREVRGVIFASSEAEVLTEAERLIVPRIGPIHEPRLQRALAQDAPSPAEAEQASAGWRELLAALARQESQLVAPWAELEIASVTREGELAHIGIQDRFVATWHTVRLRPDEDFGAVPRRAVEAFVHRDRDQVFVWREADGPARIGRRIPARLG